LKFKIKYFVFRKYEFGIEFQFVRLCFQNKSKTHEVLACDCGTDLHSFYQRNL
jgi:hypothetical protein